LSQKRCKDCAFFKKPRSCARNMKCKNGGTFACRYFFDRPIAVGDTLGVKTNKGWMFMKVTKHEVIH